MPRRPLIHLAEPNGFSPSALGLLEAVGEVRRQAIDAADLPAALRACDVFWFRLGWRVGAEALAGCRCRVLVCPVTGLDHIDLDACEAQGVRVLSLRGEVDFLREVRGTAELTVALALALLRRIPQAAEHVRAGGWDRDAFRGRELYGKAAGLVGVGRLGRIVAGYLRAFGMDVRGFDPRPDFPHDAARRAESLDELLEEADLVSLHVAYTPATRRLIGGRQFERMKPGAVLVNTARGGVVDEPALLAALRSGRLAGAALDVLDGEPAIDAAHPLVAYARDHDHLLIVPHLGGATFESFEKTEVFLARKLADLAVELAWRD